MKSRMQWFVGAAVVLMMGTAFARGEERKEHKKQQEATKACDDLHQMRASVQKLESAGPDTTAGEIKQDAKQARESFKKFEKSAEKVAKPEVENVRKSVDNLRNNAQRIPDSATASEARQMIRNDLDNVSIASNQLERKLGCGMGGAGSEGMNEPQKSPEYSPESVPTE